MSTLEAKMHHEKLEHEHAARLDEEMAGNVAVTAKLTKRVLWKMDIRYGPSPPPPPPTLPEYC
jgi:hypothetical protein